MVIGLDLSCESVTCSYLSENEVETIYVGEFSRDSFDDDLRLNVALIELRYKIEKKIASPISAVVCGIPYTCSYLIRKRIKRAFNKAGLPLLGMRFSCDLANLWLVTDRKIEKPEYSIICKASENYLEASVYYNSLTEIKTIGSMGIPIKKLKSKEEFQALEERLNKEFRQFIRDCGIGNKEGLILRLISDGCYKNTVYCIQKSSLICFGRMMDISDHIVSNGALYCALIVKDQIPVNKTVPSTIYSLHRGITVKLGEMGESSTVLDYNSPVPCMGRGRLLVSTEPILYVFEGNYGNPLYDELIESFALPECFEGHELEVTVASKDGISCFCSIQDLKTQQTVLDHYLL